MSFSDAVKSNLVLNSDDDDEMDEIIAEFAEEEEKEQVILLSKSEDEMDDLIDEFAAAESDSSCENMDDIPVILSDDDVLEAISEDFQFDCAESSSTNNSLSMPLTAMSQIASDNIVSKVEECSNKENTISTVVLESKSSKCTSPGKRSDCSVLERLLPSNKPCKNATKENESNKNSNDALSELKCNTIEKSNFSSSNSDLQKNYLTENYNYVDKANNNTVEVWKNISICNEDKTVYSSLVEILGENPSLKDGNQSPDSTENSNTNKYSLSEITSNSSSDIMVPKCKNTADEKSASNAGVPESELPCTASVNSISNNASTTLVTPNELQNTPKENLANKFTNQKDQDSVGEKVILLDTSNSVHNEINKTEESISLSGVVESHSEIGRNLQDSCTKVIHKEHTTTDNESQSHFVITTKKVNGENVVINHSIEKIKSNTNTLVSKNEPLQSSDINNSAYDSIKVQVSVEPLNRAPDNEKSEILGDKENGINSDSGMEIIAEDNKVLPVCVTEIMSTSEKSSISPERNQSRKAPEGTNEIEIVERSSNTDVPIHHKSNITIGDTQESDATVECKPDINTKRKLEVLEQELSSKRQKEDSCTVANSDEHSTDICSDLNSVNDADIEQLVPNVTQAHIKAASKVNQLFPWDPSEKIEITKKTLDRIALHVCEEVIKECYKTEYNEGKNKLKILSRRFEKLSEDLEKYRLLVCECNSSQRISFALRGYKKATSRTVGLNVKILKESDLLRILEERKAKSKTKEMESNLSAPDLSPVVPNTRIILENESNVSAPTLSPVKPNAEIMPENESNVSAPTLSPVKPNAEIMPENELPKISPLPHITPVHIPVIVSQTASAVPADIPVPQTIMEGDRLIPYIEPSKPPTARTPPVLLVPVSKSSNVSSMCKDQVALQKEKPAQTGLEHNGCVMPSTAIGKDAGMNNKTPVLVPLNDLKKMVQNSQNPNFPQQLASLPPQQSGIQNLQFVQFKTAGSNVDLTCAANGTFTTYAIPQQHQRSNACSSPSSGLVLFNHQRKVYPRFSTRDYPRFSSQNYPRFSSQNYPSFSTQNYPSLSCHPASTSYPSLEARKTLMPLQNLKMAEPHLPSLTPQPASSAPHRPTVTHQSTYLMRELPVPTQHSLSSSQQHFILRNQTPVHQHHPRYSQQCLSTAHTDSGLLQHLGTSSSLHNNSSSARHLVSSSSDVLNDKRSPFLPKPIVKGSVKEDGSVVISWNFNSSDHIKEIALYKIYSKQEKDPSDGPPIWKSVGEVASLELPMACTLNYFEENTRYHFVVLAVDKFNRCGPCSDVVVIHYQKGKNSSVNK